MSKYEPMDFPTITKVDAVTSTHVYTDIIELPSTIKQKRWKPKLGETFYVINASLLQGFVVSKHMYNNAVGLMKTISKYNACFRTKKEAQQKLKQIKAILKG